MLFDKQGSDAWVGAAGRGKPILLNVNTMELLRLMTNGGCRRVRLEKNGRKLAVRK